jgi:hypothetical protein
VPSPQWTPLVGTPDPYDPHLFGTATRVAKSGVCEGCRSTWLADWPWARRPPLLVRGGQSWLLGLGDDCPLRLGGWLGMV